MSSKSSKRLGQKILNQLVPELKGSTFYTQDFLPILLKTVDLLGLRKFEQIVCYGLGSFHDGTEIASRYQLALLLLIYDELVKLEAPIKNVIEIFDPSFEAQDLETLKTFSHVTFHLIDDNEHCARRVNNQNQNAATLVYMPHLDKHLYNNLVGANWHVGLIDRLVVLGNSFQAMIDYESSTVCQTTLYYINLLVNNLGTSTKKIAKKKDGKTPKGSSLGASLPRALIELVVSSDDNEYWEIFNNFAFHFVDESWLRENGAEIEQHRIMGWNKVVITNSDSEWQED